MILSNQVRCNHCGEEPWSASRHDFVNCSCSLSKHRVSVDGGMIYLRRVFGTSSDYTDISIVVEEEHIKPLLKMIEDKKKNSLGKLCNVMRYLRDELDINPIQKETT